MRFSDDAHFSIANIPFGIASRIQENRPPQVSTRIGSKVYFLPELISTGLLGPFLDTIQNALHETQLNKFASLGRPAHQQVRSALQLVLTTSNLDGRLDACSVHQNDVRMHLPVEVGDFSDFSCSMHHLLNAGEAMMGTKSVPPGFMHFPIGYGGRSSSIVVSGTTVTRPLGQYRYGQVVVFGQSKAMDFELEVACVVGKPSAMGEPVKIDRALDHIFGFVILNDWSARDIQGLEMNPLGPFNGKSVATTISSWVVTVDALEPFQISMPTKDGQLAAYLQSKTGLSHYPINLQAELIEKSGETSVLCNSKLDCLYWSFQEMIAHQTINGCAIRSGDLLATGTVSGSEEGTLGCLLEITKGGKQTASLQSGNQRTYLEDEDAVRLTGWIGDVDNGFGIGFGENLGLLKPTVSWDE